MILKKLFIITFLLLFKVTQVHQMESLIDDLDIAPEILPIYNEWLIDCSEKCVYPDFNRFKYIEFSDTLKSQYAGLYIFNQGILIKSEYRESPYLKVIVYHELGHAAFGLDHDFKSPNIMSPYFTDFIAQIYLNNWEKYKQDYFESVR